MGRLVGVDVDVDVDVEIEIDPNRETVLDLQPGGAIPASRV